LFNKKYTFAQGGIKFQIIYGAMVGKRALERDLEMFYAIDLIGNNEVI